MLFSLPYRLAPLCLGRHRGVACSCPRLCPAWPFFLPFPAGAAGPCAAAAPVSCLLRCLIHCACSPAPRQALCRGHAFSRRLRSSIAKAKRPGGSPSLLSWFCLSFICALQAPLCLRLPAPAPQSPPTAWASVHRRSAERPSPRPTFPPRPEAVPHPS